MQGLISQEGHMSTLGLLELHLKPDVQPFVPTKKYLETKKLKIEIYKKALYV